VLKTYGVRDNDWYAARLPGSTDWKAVRIPFTELKREKNSDPWSKHDLRSVIIQMMGQPDGRTFLELDNLAFY
ncbi:MAG TPA: hypothetical protein VGL72_01140, partial [Bryobacteraceae bacterium]